MLSKVSEAEVFDPAEPSLLTAQERRVLNLVAEALSKKEIAAELEISPATVKRHLENILKKLGLKNRIEVAVFAVKNGNDLRYCFRNPR